MPKEKYNTTMAEANIELSIRGIYLGQHEFDSITVNIQSMFKSKLLTGRKGTSVTPV